MRKSTEEIENEMKRAKTWDDLKEIMKKNGIGRETFGDRLLELCTKYEVRPADLERKVAISKSQFYAVMNGTRNPSKENVIKIALGLGVTIEEINALLKLAKHKELYPKNKEDAIIKFGIEHKKDIYEINEMLKEYGSKINLIDEE